MKTLPSVDDGHRAVDRAVDVDRDRRLLGRQPEPPALVADGHGPGERLDDRGLQLGAGALGLEAADVDAVDGHALGDLLRDLAVEGVQAPRAHEEHGDGENEDGEQTARHERRRG